MSPTPLPTTETWNVNHHREMGMKVGFGYFAVGL